MAKERYKTCVDVHLILRRGDEILLGERRNTGWRDGDWHLPSGHLDPGEAASAALIRETAEEIGVAVDAAAVRFAHLMHHFTDDARTAMFFEVTQWTGEVVNREPDKCAGWDWFPLDALPEQMIPYAAEALTLYAKGTVYSERGWS
ncbi:NUDIX domain-containing protein [Sphaerisporangium album]|uniref:NUDIX domain-containing protein n=1 Tax=Sphaerisporangium album TaxID=509200 RepID=A0A367EM36_9ACTN|nr:NUDIX domain-containing protein [Sphaerisporangium album]RCG19101.1 NUDIX domain-containing protein [Sphaerisporangium album]